MKPVIGSEPTFSALGRLEGLSVAQNDASSVPKATIVMEKEGAQASAASHKKVSPSKRSSKTKPVAREKHPARADPPRKQTVAKSSPQPDEEKQASELTLVQRKRKLPDVQVRVVLLLEFPLRWARF